jgi:hypothetical protein
MSIGRRLKQPRGKDPKATRTPRSTNKRSKEARAEELSPEQRVEFAQQIEAKEFRGRPAPRRRRGRVRAYSASEYRGSAARHAASGSPISLRTMFVPSTIATILYCAWRRLMPSRPIPQSEEITIARAGCASAPRGRCRRPGPSVPRTEDTAFSRPSRSTTPALPDRRRDRLFHERDRGFESRLLQRRVSCEPDFRGASHR